MKTFSVQIHFYIVVFSLFLSGCASIPVVSRYTTPASVSEEKVWKQVRHESSKHGLDPHFVYAIAWAESSLRPHAATHKARGIMQVSEIAWKTVTEENYAKAWHWKDNIRIGTLYLAYCKRFLNKHGQFSYPLLAASYRYGPNAVKNQGFKVQNMPKPTNKIYKELFAGKRAPVKTPS